MSVQAKICGLRDEVTIQATIEGNAAYIGFVFYPKSPRAVTVQRAAKLCRFRDQSVAQRGTPECAQTVGLIVDMEDGPLEALLSETNLALLQLHGRETPERVADIRKRSGKPVIKAISIATKEDVLAAKAYEAVADILLFDAKPSPAQKAALPGGNALQFDWRLLEGCVFECPWMLAGGLKASNVAEAVSVTQASSVDTSSGVEDAPGIKNIDKIKEFLAVTASL